MSRPAALLSGLCALGLLAGCVSGPRYQRPAVAVPEVIRGQAGPATPGDAASFADQAWWAVFHDDALKGLIAEALRNGYDVRLAAARVAEAEANAGVVRAERFPALTPSVQVGHGQSSTFSTGAGAAGSLVQVNLGLSWELDLWGRIRRSNEAAPPWSRRLKRSKVPWKASVVRRAISS